QIIDPAKPVSIKLVDLGHVSPHQREARAIELARKEIKQPFALSRGSMLRTVLIRNADNDHLLVINVHHIAFDAWSTGILVRELDSLYSSYRSEREPAPAELPVQYADFAVWQRVSLEGEHLQHRIGYWKEKLAELPNGVDLPTDRPRPSVQSFRGDNRSMLVAEPVLRGLHDLSRSEGVTLFMTLLAAFNVLLARYS